MIATAFPRAVASSSQYNHGTDLPGKGVGNTILTAQVFKTGLCVISGGGANSLLRLNANGLILVDGKLPGNYYALSKRVRRISDHPIPFLAVTHYQLSGW